MGGADFPTYINQSAQWGQFPILRISIFGTARAEEKEFPQSRFRWSVAQAHTTLFTDRPGWNLFPADGIMDVVWIDGAWRNVRFTF